MKKIIFLFFVGVMLTLFAPCILAQETDINVTSASELLSAVENGEKGDVVSIVMGADFTLDQSVVINKEITVNFSFNGYQLSYTGKGDSNTAVGAFCLENPEAVLNLIGGRALSALDYTHYEDSVKADMVGTGNLISIKYGRVNIQNAYLNATNDTYVIYVDLIAKADAYVTVDSSVLRTKQGSDKGAVCYRGGNDNSANGTVVKKILMLENSVVYGGFKGHSCSFNVTRGSVFNEVKFYDFAITNDSWLNTGSLYANTFENAILFNRCLFRQYDEQIGTVSVKTETGKHNIKLYECQFSSVESGGKFSGDSGGTTYIYVVEKAPSCIEDGWAYSYSSPKGAQGTGTMAEYKNEGWALSKVGHAYGMERITYKNGYGESGIGVVACTVCSELSETDNFYEPIFKSQGFSINQQDNSFALGVALNVEAYEAFIKNNPLTVIDYGFLYGGEAISVNCESGAVVVKNGNAVSVKDKVGIFFDLKISGFSAQTAEKPLVAEFYVNDGNISYVNGKNGELTAVTFNQIKEELDSLRVAARELLYSKHKLYYNDDGSFRVLIIADAHMNVSSDAHKVQAVKDRIKLLVDREQPNLVIFTGDNTIGSSTEARLRDNISALVSYIEEKQIPWCHVYGNHDHENALNEEAQQKVYESFEYCISKSDSQELTGTGNYALGVYDKNGVLGSVIYCLDSGTYYNDGYDYIREDQIEWYRSCSALLKKYNGGKPVKGMMAFHIPLIENNHAYNNRLNKELVYEVQGARNEAICSSAVDTGLLEAVWECGDVTAIVTGHDHVNDYMYNYKGVKLASSPNVSNLTYTDEGVQGGRVFDLNKKTLDNIPTYVSYIVKRVNPDDYEVYGTDISLENFDTDTGLTFAIGGLDGGSMNGNFTVEVRDGRLVLVRNSSGNVEVDIYFSEDNYGKLGDNRYLVVWADFTNVDFRKASFGLISSNGTHPYRTDDYDRNSPFYYLADGANEWVEMSHGDDGCFGTNQGSSVKGKKGYFAFPTEYFSYGGSLANESVLVTGIYFYCDVNTGTGKEFYFDSFMLVEDYKSTLLF